MSMKPRGLEPIPEETRRLAHRLSPKGTLVTQVRDALGPIYSDEQFAHLFPTRGRAAEAPWRLAMAAGLNLKRISAQLHAQSLGKPTRTARPKSPFARLQEEKVA